MNGHRLLGMNHIEVVTILKELPMAVRMVCARRNGDGNALRLIDTSQDRAAFAARVIFFFACLFEWLCRAVWVVLAAGLFGAFICLAAKAAFYEIVFFHGVIASLEYILQ